MRSYPSFQLNERIYKWMAITAILLGVIVRIAVYLQNRNLFIDEANVARNVYERGFAALAAPLSYEQYAPPIFLWITKLSTTLFGYGELAFRLYPLLAGIASLFVMYALLRQLGVGKSLWYPLAMMAVAYIFIRYSTELKQYISDVLVILSLLLIALKVDIIKLSPGRFILLWFIAGSIGIWACMPSVFILAGIGAYYFYTCIHTKVYKKLAPVFITGGLWIAEFVIYYIAILKPQIDSNYLQNFHMDYFLYATPGSTEEWKHNIEVCRNLLTEASGFTALAIVFNGLLLLIALVYGSIKNKAQTLLIALPLFAVLIAAALNQFSLIPRVALFTIPIILIGIAMGMEVLMRLNRLVITVPVMVVALICAYNHSMFSMTWKPQETEQVTDAMNFAGANGIKKGNQVYLHNGARPAFIYYTTIHPLKDKWTSIRDAHLLSWDADYDRLAATAASPSVFIFTSVYSEDLTRTRATIEKYKKATNKLEKPGCFAYIYVEP